MVADQKKSGPFLPYVYFYLASSYYEAGKYQDALTYLEKVMNSPIDQFYKTASHLKKILIYLYKNDLVTANDLAKLPITNLLEGPDKIKLKIHQGKSYLESGNIQLGQDLLQDYFWKIRSPRLYKKFKPFMEANRLFFQDQWYQSADAANMMQAVIKNQDETVVMRLAKEILILGKNNTIAQAISPSLIKTFGRYFFAKRDYKNARKYYYMLADTSKNKQIQTAALFQLARIYSRLEHKKLAKRSYQQVMHTGATRAMKRKATYALAFNYLYDKNYASAINLFRKLGGSRSSAWYAAWGSYLKGDVKQSNIKFTWLAKKNRRSKAGLKAEFWKAMSAKKIGHKIVSHKLLKKLSQASNRPRYYNLIAQHQIAANLIENKEPLPTYNLYHRLNDSMLKHASHLPKESLVAQLFNLGYQEDANKLLKQKFQTEPDQNTVFIPYASHFYRINDYRTPFLFAHKKLQQPDDLDPGETIVYEQAYYPQVYPTIVEKYAKQFKVDKSLIWSIIRAESAFRETARSHVGASGLMQIMPKTGQRLADELGESNFSTEMLNQPDVNIRYGTYYLSILLKRYHNNHLLAAAAYNAGEERVDLWRQRFSDQTIVEFVETIPFSETKNYVKKVLTNLYNYRKLYEISEKDPIRYVQLPELRPKPIQLTQN